MTALSILLLTQGVAGCSAKRNAGSVSVSDEAIVSSEGTTSIENAVAGASLFPEEKSIVSLKNHMSDQERSKVTSGPLTVLDEPWNKPREKDERMAEYQNGVYFEICTKEDMLRDIEENPEAYAGWTDEELEDYKTNFVSYIRGYIVDGRHYGSMISTPLEDEKTYGWYSVLEGETLTTKEIKDLQELKDMLPKILEEYRKDEYKYFYFGSDLDEKQWGKDIIRIFEAKRDKTYKTMPFGTTNQIAEYYQKIRNQQEDLAWELDKDAVEAIKDQVTEYHFYDEELDRELVIHVAIPKGHESSAAKTLAVDVQPEVLPAFVLTDAVWRFNDIAKLLGEMEAGRAKPQILISIGQDYAICNSENMERSAVFCEGKDKFLDFITDDLMPYLSEKYNIDFENSTLFGHSLGGVFAHYAAFNSDRYENQPFGKYIIGSPAFWSPYSTEMKDFKDQKNDYGYFDRNQTMNKKILITGGTDENEDYQEYFGENDSTLDAIAHLEERVNAHCDAANPMAQSKLYKSHHYQYIPDMLKEYVDETI